MEIEKSMFKFKQRYGNMLAKGSLLEMINFQDIGVTISSMYA